MTKSKTQSQATSKENPYAKQLRQAYRTFQAYDKALRQHATPNYTPIADIDTFAVVVDGWHMALIEAMQSYVGATKAESDFSFKVYGVSLNP